MSKVNTLNMDTEFFSLEERIEYLRLKIKSGERALKLMSVGALYPADQEDYDRLADHVKALDDELGWLETTLMDI